MSCVTSFSESDSQAEITGAHDSAVFGLEWHPMGHLLASASNDHTTRFWARNRPGDDMTDKYNVNQLPDEQKLLAVHTLVEAAQKNPSKYGRLPAALASIAELGNAGADGEAAAGGFGAAAAAYRHANTAYDSTPEVIPGQLDHQCSGSLSCCIFHPS